MRLIGNFVETSEMKKIRQQACNKCSEDCSQCMIYLNKDKRISTFKEEDEQ
jgi:hypothetical protein